MILNKVTEDILGRDFYSTRLDAVIDFAIPFPGKYYVALVWSHRGISSSKADMLGQSLILSGCRYIVTAGSHARALENAFDMTYVRLVKTGQLGEDDFVMTASQQDERVYDVIQFFAHNTNFDSHDFTRFLIVFLDIPKKSASPSLE